jgi:cytoskeletal protein RodZ
MTPELSTHLSEEAMDDVLIGLASPESDAHLAACSLCRSQLQEFRSAMQVFNQTSLAWSEDRSKAFHHSSAKPKIRPAIFVPLSWAMVAAVLLAIGFPMWNHHYLSRNYAPGPASTPENSEAQIAQDNELLQSVNLALNESDVPQINMYDLSDGPHPQLKVRPELRNR